VTTPVVFFNRCRPNCDIINLVLDQKRVFIGYPAYRPGKYLQDRDFRDALIDLSSPDQDQDPLAAEIDSRSYRRGISANRNLVRDVQPGAIVLVPRGRRTKYSFPA
jgi:hypothetical protein